MTQIVVMPGGFHPFHAGHLALYNSARKAFPRAEVFVAATNDTSTRPFPFAIKEKLAKLAGVEPGHFVQVKSPFRAEEITSRFNPEKDVLIFVRSEKDADKPPQAGGVKRDGSPSYLQPLAGQTRYEPFARHAYMAYLPTVEFGPGMTSATEIRSAWPRLNEKRKTALVMSLYPKTQSNPKLAATVVKLLDAAIGTEQSVAEAFDSQGYHTSVSKGKYLPSEYGQDENNLYLHDLMNSAHDGSGPKIVTIDDKRIATEVAAMFGGYVEKTPMRTYRIYQPRGATQSAKTPELTGVAEGTTEDFEQVHHSEVERFINVHGTPGEYTHKYDSMGQAHNSYLTYPNRTVTINTQKYGDRFGHNVFTKKEQGVEENQGWAATLEEKHRGNLNADPELQQAKRFAVQHYPEFADDPDMAFDKWVQRSLEHGLEDDQKQFKMLQGVAEKIKRLEQAVAQARAQQSAVQESDYIEEKWSQKYKNSINCANPQGFSQKAHCAGRKK